MKKMKRFMKKAFAYVLAASLAISLIPSMGAQAKRGVARKKPAVKSIAVKSGGKTVTKKTITLTVRKSTTLKVVVKPANAKKKVGYSSSNKKVASVSAKGKVTAWKAGIATIKIIVTGKNGKKKSSYVRVKVQNKKKPEKKPTPKPTVVAVESVKATISPSELTVGDTAQIAAEVLPSNATDKKLSYASSDAQVASVDPTGKVTANAAGTAKITVSSSNNKSAQVEVSVKEKPIEAERVTASVLPSTSILVGDVVQVTAEVLPVDATDKSLTYTSSDEAVATVDGTGKVTAKKTGTAVIKAAASNGKSAEITFDVLEKYEIETKEHIVTDGNDRIYGTLYAPKQEGTWPAVILSHGYNGYNAQFEPDCTYFAEHGFIAYAYDFCGGGNASKSSGKSTEMTVFTEKANLLSVFNDVKEMDGVDADRIFLLGGSMGGFVTTLAAEELIGQVEGLVLYFPALNVPDDWRNNFKEEKDIPEDTYLFWDLMLGREFFTSIRDFYTFDNIGKFPDPVLIIWGDQDPIVPRQYPEQAQETYPDAKLIVVPGVGHDSSSAIFRESALSFLKETLASGK